MPLSPVHHAVLAASACLAVTAGMVAALCPHKGIASAAAVVALTAVVELTALLVLLAGVLLVGRERRAGRHTAGPARGVASVPYPPLPGTVDDADAVYTPLDDLLDGPSVDARWLHIIAPYRPWGNSVIRREARIRGQAIGQDGGDDE